MECRCGQRTFTFPAETRFDNVMSARAAASSALLFSGGYMRRTTWLGVPALCVSAVLLCASAAQAAPPAHEKQHGRPNLDARSGRVVSDRQAQLAANPSAAVKAFNASLGAQGIVSF